MLRRSLLVVSLCAAVLAGPSCKREKKPAKAGAVKLIVDGKETSSFDPPATPVPLASLLPKGTAPYAAWKRLQADASGGRFLDISAPAASYPDVEVRVYSDRGKAAIGLFRPVKPDLPESIAKIARQPAVSLADIHEIRVRVTEPGGAEGAGGDEDAAAVPDLAVLVGTEEKTLTGAQLAAIEPVTGPTQQARGWPLADVLAPVVAPGKVASVKVEGWKGITEEISAEDLANRDVWLLFKSNKKGELVFRRWEKGKNEAVGEVRGVRVVRVTPTEAPK